MTDPEWEPCYRCPFCGNIITDGALASITKEIYSDISGGPDGSKEPEGDIAICPKCGKVAFVRDV
jgi:hypothetical protein